VLVAVGSTATAALLTVLLRPAPAHAQSRAVLSFDDLGVPPGGRRTLNNQYAAQGVTFNDVMAIDYAQPSFPAGFAHSGTVGIEQCFAVEFCTAPIRASFTDGQQRVKVWVGASFRLEQPLTVRLTVFDENRVSVGSAQVILPAATGVTPIATPLEVSLASAATIRSLEISVPGGYMNGVAVDDLEFSTVGPPPPCSASSVPGVTLTRPAGGLLVQKNEFPLEGSVTTGGAPLESASIERAAIPGGEAAGTAELYPSLIQANGGHFGPTNMAGLLVPGVNHLVVRAANCRGTGVSVAVEVTWSSGTAEVCRFIGQPRPVVDIKGSTKEWKDCLVRAVGTPGTTVRLDGRVDMALDGYEPIWVASGVTLTGEPGSRRGQNLGPRLRIMIRPPGKNSGVSGSIVYFRIVRTEQGDAPAGCSDDRTIANVRLSGFRLQGPTPEVYESNVFKRAIAIEGCRGVEIANMDLSGWNGSAVYVASGTPLCPHDLDHPESVWIHDNFIHNNQSVGTNGYGVDVSAGACARIERNVFDFNRHAITASGKGLSAYRASQNLVLRGGGVHGKWYSQQTHLFDVHGDRNCPDTFATRHIWNCGNAGALFWYTDNAFQYKKDNAIKLRGVPREKVYIENNVFAHGSLDDAVHLNGYAGLGQSLDKARHARLRSNRAKMDTFGKYGVCDFDGDGRDDLFLPTGVTWWYSSGGSMNWVYLNGARELPGEFALGDFDGDRRCDVFAVHGNRWEISSGGSRRWRSLGSYGLALKDLRFGNFDADPATEVFRRDAHGQWYILSPGAGGWQPAQSSGFPLSQLRFGDFTGDGIMDVLAVVGGRWSISAGATQPWQRINPALGTRLDSSSILIADVNGNGTDDVVRSSVVLGLPNGTTRPVSVKWEVSWDGRSGWQTLKVVGVEPSPLLLTRPEVFLLAGRFDGARGSDLLAIDSSRFGRLYSNVNRAIARLNRYAY
jgi:hypothetical protein